MYFLTYWKRGNRVLYFGEISYHDVSCKAELQLKAAHTKINCIKYLRNSIKTANTVTESCAEVRKLEESRNNRRRQNKKYCI